MWSIQAHTLFRISQMLHIFIQVLKTILILNMMLVCPVNFYNFNINSLNQSLNLNCLIENVLWQNY